MCNQGDQACVSTHLPVPRGENREVEQQRRVSSIGSSFNHAMSKPQESIRKPMEPRVCSTVFELDSLTHDDQRAGECCPIHCAQLVESSSKLDSKSPLSNKSIFLFYFLTNCLSACQQLGELSAISQRKRFELCTWLFFYFFSFFMQSNSYTVV